MGERVRLPGIGPATASDAGFAPSEALLTGGEPAAPAARASREAGDATASERIAVLAPTARDGPLTASLLAKAGFGCVLARDMDDLCRIVDEGAATAFVAEEVLVPSAAARLRDVVARQEPWSDLPIVVFTAPGTGLHPRRPALEMLVASGNVTLLDRPVQPITLVSAARAALRARHRQYATRDLLDQLAASVRTRDRFLAMLGHELRNPLGAIQMASELISRRPDDASRASAVISRQCRKLARLVDDLLEVSRVASGKLALRRARVDMRAVVERSVESVEAAARRQGLRIEVSLPDRPVPVDGDAVRLEQVVANLLSNAVKYTPGGGRVTVALEGGSSALLRVRDTGVGIPPAMLERIFEPFTQASESLDRSEGGLGLGLALVRGLVDLHGGKVRAHSEGPGRGSEFVVELPAVPDVAPALRGGEAPAAVRAEGRRVVVVEDNADNRETLVMLLELLGHRVTSACDGPGGARAVLEERPDVAIVDIGLPGFDGYEVARRVRSALGREVLLVALTGYGQAEDRERARKAGFDVHLTKPADANVIARAVALAGSSAAVAAR